jgi:hypothetical protein
MQATALPLGLSSLTLAGAGPAVTSARWLIAHYGEEGAGSEPQPQLVRVGGAHRDVGRDPGDLGGQPRGAVGRVEVARLPRPFALEAVVGVQVVEGKRGRGSQASTTDGFAR